MMIVGAHEHWTCDDTVGGIFTRLGQKEGRIRIIKHSSVTPDN